MGRGGTDDADLTDVAVAIESYLVRRMVCGYQTRSYGSLALRLLKAIRDTPADAPAAPAIAAELAASVGGAESWPDDEEFGRHWRQRNFYNGLRRSRTLMALKAFEEAYQARFCKGEPILTFDLDKLRIEHVMPQSWHEHWPISDSVSAEQRTWALNGVGNVTLVSDRLNPSLSNGPWIGATDACKSEGLRRHSKLEMNRRLLDDHPEWTAGSIAQRADDLFRGARVIWPPAPGCDVRGKLTLDDTGWSSGPSGMSACAVQDEDSTARSRLVSVEAKNSAAHSPHASQRSTRSQRPPPTVVFFGMMVLL